MANEIRTRYSSTGATIYRQVIRASDGFIYNGTSFSAVPIAASWSSYSSALTPQSTTQYYYGNFPAVAAALYNVYLYLQSGGSPATTDTLIEVQTIDWKGSSEVTLSAFSIGVGGTVTVISVNDDAIGATSLSQEAKEEIAVYVRAELATELARIDVATSVVAAYVDTEVAAIYSRLGAPAGASISADIAAVKSETAAILDDTGTSGVVVASLAANSITASALASDAALEIADAILGRSVSTIEGTASEHSLCTMILGALESSVSGTTWTIKRTDGSATHYTKTLTTGSADPITGVS